MPKYRVLWNAFVQFAADIEAADEDNAWQAAQSLPAEFAHPHVVSCTLEDLKELKEPTMPKGGKEE